MRSDMLTRIALTGAAGALALPAAAGAASPAPAPVRLDGDALAPLLHAAKTPLVHRDVRLARKVAHVKGTELPAGYAETLRSWRIGRLRRHHRELRHDLVVARRAARGSATSAGGSTASGTLQAIAACESGGNPSADTGNGFYGKYQFTMSTWQAVGGSGNPAQASEAEQDARAAQLYSSAGAGQWPVCGR